MLDSGYSFSIQTSQYLVHRIRDDAKNGICLLQTALSSGLAAVYGSLHHLDEQKEDLSTFSGILFSKEGALGGLQSKEGVQEKVRFILREENVLCAYVTSML